MHSFDNIQNLQFNDLITNLTMYNLIKGTMRRYILFRYNKVIFENNKSFDFFDSL